MSKDLVRDGGYPGQYLLRLAWLSTILLAIVAALGLAASVCSSCFVFDVSLRFLLVVAWLALRAAT